MPTPLLRLRGCALGALPSYSAPFAAASLRCSLRAEMRNPCLSGFPLKDISPTLHIREPYDADDMIVNASQGKIRCTMYRMAVKPVQSRDREEFVMIPPAAENRDRQENQTPVFSRVLLNLKRIDADMLDCRFITSPTLSTNVFVQRCCPCPDPFRIQLSRVDSQNGGLLDVTRAVYYLNQVNA